MLSPPPLKKKKKKIQSIIKLGTKFINIKGPKL